MTAKFSASADGTKVNIGNASEDALQIDSVAKTIKALAPYLLFGTEVVTTASGVGIKFPDGTLICVASGSVASGPWSATTPAGGAFASFGGVAVYPVPFVGSLPRVMGWGNEQDISARSAYVSNLSTTLVGCTGGFFSAPCVPTNQSVIQVTVLAYGRWKA